MGWGRYTPVNNPGSSVSDTHPSQNNNGNNHDDIEITDWSQYSSAAESVLQGRFSIDEFHDEEEDDRDGNSSSSSSSARRRPQQPLRPPSNFICPLTLQLIDIPMTDSCGHTFDYDAIHAWLEIHEMCPISRKPMHLRNLIVNKALKKRIRLWKRQHPQYIYGQEGFYVRGGYNRPSSSHVVVHATDDSTGSTGDDTNQCDDRDRYQETISPMELILLPQERKMLGAIKTRALALRKLRQRQNCVYAIAGVVVGILIIAFTFAIKNLSERFAGGK
jgi:hypothetical protein